MFGFRRCQSRPRKIAHKVVDPLQAERGIFHRGREDIHDNVCTRETGVSRIAQYDAEARVTAYTNCRARTTQSCMRKAVSSGGRTSTKTEHVQHVVGLIEEFDVEPQFPHERVVRPAPRKATTINRCKVSIEKDIEGTDTACLRYEAHR